jgi:disulfide oxidoreductase YuzD
MEDHIRIILNNLTTYYIEEYYTDLLSFMTGVDALYKYESKFTLIAYKLNNGDRYVSYQRVMPKYITIDSPIINETFYRIFVYHHVTSPMTIESFILMHGRCGKTYKDFALLIIDLKNNNKSLNLNEALTKMFINDDKYIFNIIVDNPRYYQEGYSRLFLSSNNNINTRGKEITTHIVSNVIDTITKSFLIKYSDIMPDIISIIIKMLYKITCPLFLSVK